MPKITDNRRADADSTAPADTDQRARELALKKLERRRAFLPAPGR